MDVMHQYCWMTQPPSQASKMQDQIEIQARGFEVIDAIKTSVEAACNATVSCADILALATRDGVVLLGGPSWTVPLGRRDSRTASQSAANSQIPGPSSNLATLTAMFSAKGLNARELTILSGAHTIGLAQCGNFRNRIYNDTNINASFATTRRANCPADGSGNTNLAPLDTLTKNQFDNNYYQNLLVRRGLLHSDQELFNGGSQDALVRTYSTNNAAFSTDFAAAMVKLGNISPLTGTNGEIRRNCGDSQLSLNYKIIWVNIYMWLNKFCIRVLQHQNVLLVKMYLLKFIKCLYMRYSCLSQFSE
ncbi:Peroxidase [Quillaja saponaria]|uniref:Peroxidase n=1 Tax=Quillaja saponaria TaxID=32244 RepID=A0AAD7KZ58_QUISA|nr:Peroxidase [Quillaja saponaria]